MGDYSGSPETYLTAVVLSCFKGSVLTKKEDN